MVKSAERTCYHIWKPAKGGKCYWLWERCYASRSAANKAKRRGWAHSLDGAERICIPADSMVLKCRGDACPCDTWWHGCCGDAVGDPFSGLSK